MSPKKPKGRPVWYKYTYFWFGAILFLLGLIGLPFLMGDEAIRDPGQTREDNLYLLYFAASAVMFINGYISFRQTIQYYEEEKGGS